MVVVVVKFEIRLDVGKMQFISQDIFYFSVRLIIVVPLDCVSDFHLHRLLDNIFQAMVLVVGLDDLIALRHIDRVKRELRASYSLVDCLLNGLTPNERTTFFGDLIGAPDILVCQV